LAKGAAEAAAADEAEAIATRMAELKRRQEAGELTPEELAELQEVDVLSLLVAGLCHDLGHDGLTNGYHVNAMSERAVRYSDVSVQENYHAAETFKLMQREQFLNVT
jgi:alkylhydroperoxidase family enzyme